MVAGRAAAAARRGRRRPAGILLVLTLAGAAVAATPQFPALSGRVVDAGGILDAATRTTLDQELAGFEANSDGTQVVVVTVPSLGGRAIEEYGYQLGRHWGIGQRGENNGVLLIVAPAERQVRIEVGYGLEGELTDAVSWDIIQGRILPAFRDGDVNAGVIAGARAIIAVLDGDYQPSEPRPARERRHGIGFALWIFVVLIVLSGFGRGGGLGGRRGWRRALITGAVLGGLGGGRSGGAGGGFGGGGFSGGGGGFGGGGASGGW